MIQNHYSEEDLHNAFEPLYWKLPELINAIEVNFKSIYLKNQKKIDKYYETKHKEYLKHHSDDDMRARKAKLVKEFTEAREQDKYYVFNKFANKEYILNDYSEMEINKKKNLYFTENNYSFSFLQEFYQVLYDYKLILNYNPFLKNLKEILGTVSTLKDAKNKALKKVLASEKKIKKLVGKGLFGKEKDPDSYIIKFKEMLHTLVEDYIELERSTFLDSIYRHFSMDSSPEDALELVSSNYLHFANIITEGQDNPTLEFIDNKYKELKEILLYNNFVILDNISLLDEYQMKQVIVDKYSLDGVKITIEQLENDNIDKTLNDIKILINNEYITRSGIKLDDIKLYFDVKNLNL